MDLLVRGARLLSGDPVDIGIANGQITSITPAITGPPESAPGAVIEAEGLAVAPGLIDAHRHGWQAPLRGIGPDMTLPDYLDAVLGRALPTFKPDDLHRATLLAAREALDAGITTVFDWSHATVDQERSEAVLDAYESAGIRAVVAYSGGDQAGARRFAELDGRVTGALTTLGPEHGGWDAAVREIGLALDLGLMVSMHVGAGPDSALWRLREAGLLGPRVQLVHANQITTEDAKVLAGEGVPVVVTPVVEATMGHGASAYSRLVAAGLKPALGTDVVVNAPADLFEPMRATLQQHRLATGAMTPAATFLAAATEDAARAIGLGGVTGTLAVGHRADLILLDGLAHLPDPAGALVTTGRPSDVRAVIVDGRVVKQSFSDATA